VGGKQAYVWDSAFPWFSRLVDLLISKFRFFSLFGFFSPLSFPVDGGKDVGHTFLFTRWAFRNIHYAFGPL